MLNIKGKQNDNGTENNAIQSGGERNEEVRLFSQCHLNKSEHLRFAKHRQYVLSAQTKQYNHLCTDFRRFIFGFWELFRNVRFS